MSHGGPCRPGRDLLVLTSNIGRLSRSLQQKPKSGSDQAGRHLSALLRQYPGHPYKKWQGAHWRLLSLVELGVVRADPTMIRALNQVLDWLLDPARPVSRIAGRYRMHASQEGNALLVCCRLGLGGDPRVSELASRLAEWQWSDGGWNCDPRPEVTHSSFHESLAPLRGLVAQGTFSDAATRAADFFLRHRLYRSESGDLVIDREWLRLHWPAYWH